MKKRKVCVVVASRANYGRIKTVLEAIREHPNLELQLVVGASALLYRFGKAIDLIRKDGFEPNATIYMVIEGETPTTMAKSTGLAIVELSTIFENLHPDIVLTVADRYETLATAVAASYMNIPLAHTQGGEMTGSIDEGVRHSITKLANLHFPATQKSAENIIRMGENPKHVYMTGCPAIDVISRMDLSIDSLSEAYGGTGAPINWKKPYILVLQHPVTTEFGDGMRQINETIKAIHALRVQTVWLWPNVDAGSDDISKGIRMYREEYRPDFVHFYRNFAVEDYARVLNNCSCIIGNSSSGIREGAYLGTPCVIVGSRQHSRERAGNVIEVGHDAAAIQQAVEKQIAHGRYPKSLIFGDGTAGHKIADILAIADLDITKTLHYKME
jgi:UDP-hydrolysing UDP-N-acetyl-D-glucosamine 2-epimerase